VKRRIRLSKTKDFQRVQRFGEAYTHKLIVLIALSNQEERTRIGVVAGKAIGKAVQRNRAKRLLRAAVQNLYPSLPAGWDIVLIARRQMVEASYRNTEAALRVLLQKACLL
jgi:ribonuclease P protein component